MKKFVALQIILTAIFFVLNAQAQTPTISSFSPSSGPVGTLVTITGTNLTSPTAFTIGGASAIVISNTGTSLVGMVMPGATTAAISITTAGGTVNSATNFTITPTLYPNAQQGSKLVGSGNTGAAAQGYSVAVSADGNTAIVGGQLDNSFQGAAWVYTRSGSTWSQQGGKLVGTGNIGAARQGWSVSLSADGNTAIVGGLGDNSFQGAAWVYSRSGSTWTQQGSKLVGTGSIGASRQGHSVSLSADGNTVIVGGGDDDSNQGAAWVYTRSGSTWTQQGSKLVGTGNIGSALQGYSVAVSADGNTAIVGGQLDNSNQGAAWVYTRSGSTWAQQGSKLVGTGNSGNAYQGISVSISADGNTAIVGGYLDNIGQGAAWVYSRSGGTWAQQGAKLVGTGNIGAARQGESVSLSADGNTAIIGGRFDNSNQGAAWVYTRSGSTWAQQGSKLVGTGNTGVAGQGFSVSLSADANTAIVGGFSDDTQQGAAWVFTNVTPPTIASFTPTTASVGTTVTITGTNFNTTASNNIVFFGATKATVSSASATSLTVTVPAGATHAAISVLNTATTLAAYSQAFFLPTFTPNKGSITSADIEAKVDFTTGTSPFSAAIGDIDGDGKPDLAVANYGSTTVSVLRNTGSSGSTSFATKVDFTTGSSPISVAIGDIDGDGKPDLAVTNSASNTVSVLRNTGSSGSISFATKVDFVTGLAPTPVAIGDIDGDGKPDLAVANNTSNTISVLRNNGSSGSISFATKVDFATGLAPYSVAIGDIDGDGMPDLAVPNINSTTVSVLRNTGSSGSISFAAKVDFGTGSGPFSVAIGDVDRDGMPDLAVANVNTATVSVLRNTGSSGSISFATKIDFTTGTDPYSVSIGDIDGDGKPELAIANYVSNTVSVLRNTGSSGSISFATKVDFTMGGAPRTIAIGDIDGDGKPDLAVANVNSATVSVLRNAPVFPPPTITSFTPTSAPVGTTVTITGTNFNTTASSNIVFFGATKATVSAATATSLTVTVPTGATYQPISVLNSTTALAGYSAKPFLTTFTPAKGSITSSDMATKVDFTTGTVPRNVAIGDLDGDGKPDLVVANTSSNTVSVYRNTSTSGTVTASSFAAKVDFATGNGPISVAIGDLDGDGKPDLAVANANAITLSVFRNTSTSGAITVSSFAAKIDLTNASGSYGVAIGDLDGDGKPDLATANYGSNTVSVFRNTSASGSITASSFAARVDYTTGIGPYGIAVGDLDGDGKPDLGVSNQDGNTVSVFRNTSASGSITASSFAAKVDYTTGTRPRGVAIGDLDGDGKPDLAVANSGGTSVSLFHNASASGSITASSFAAKVDFTTGSNLQSVAIGDLDGDGKLDLAGANDGNSTVSVFRNTSASGSITASSFAVKVDFATGTNPYSVAIGDLDGDGKPDLALANVNSNTVSVLRNSPLFAPTTQATSVLFTSTTATSTTASWTNGNGASRAVFMLAGSSGSPAPVDLTAYTANAAFASGTQIASTGWYCIYNGTGTTVNITGLTAGTTYRVMTVEYNGSGSGVAYLTSTATGNPANVTVGPVISTTGTLSAVNTTYGTASATPTTFNVGGTNLTANLVITPPSGFEISSTSSTSGYASTVTLVPSAGTVSTTAIYLRLSATTAVGTYGSSGNVVCTSTGATTANIATVSSTISAAPLTITASNANKTYGSALTGGTGSTAFTSTGLVNSETIGTVTIAYTSGAGNGNTEADAVGTYTGKVTPSAATGGTFTAANYAITYAAGNIIVGKAAQTITFAALPAKTFGDVAFNLTASGGASGNAVTYASSNTAVATVSGSTVTIVGVGTTNITASQASDANYDAATDVVQGLTVAKASQTITFAALPAKTFGDVAFNLTASGGASGNAIIYASSNTTVATVSGSTVTIVGVGTTNITASQASDANYDAATDVVQGLTLAKSAQTITFAALPAKTLGDVAFNLTASGGASGNAVTYASSNTAVATISGSTVTIVGAGTTNITASQAGNASYNAAVDAVQALSVAKAAQTITFAALPAKTFGDVAFNLTASGGASGNAVTYASSNTAVATISGSTVTIVGAGTTNITASQVGNTNYNAATDVVQALTVGKAAQTITFAALPAKTFGDVAFNLTASGGASGNAVTYASSNTAVAIISGSTVTIVGAGTTNITASQAGNANYNAATDIVQALSVSNIVTLSALSITSGTISPAFSAATTTYSSSVSTSTATIRVTPAVSNPTMLIKVNGSPVNSGEPSAPISLSFGINTIEISVTAQGGTIKTYSLSVTRAAPLSTNAELSALSLSSGVLSPSFASATYSYTAAVSNTVSSISVTPIVAQAGASVKVNGASVNSGSSSANITLNVGNNSIVTTVTAQDGNAIRTYTLNIIRAAPTQEITNPGGNVTLNNATPQLLITSPTQAVNVNVATGTNNPTVDYGMLVSAGGGTLPKTSITSSVAVLDIPSATIVSSTSNLWNGILSAPAITTYELPTPEGEVSNTGLIIEVGSRESSLSFDRGVRILFPGQGGMRVAREHAGTLTEITTVGPSDTQAAGDALPANGTFKINVGNDLVIWTKVFSRFITFTRTIDPDVAKVASDKFLLTEDLIKGGNAGLADIMVPLTNPLPSLGSNGSAITWVSDNPNIVSNDGQIVSRPDLLSGDATVNLSAIVKKGRITSTQVFTLRVLAQPNQAPTLAPIANQVLCYTTSTQNIPLSGITSGRESYQAYNLTVGSTNTNLFSDLRITPVSNGAGTINYTIRPGAVGNAIITVTVKDNGGVANGGADTFVRSFTIQVNALPVVQLSSSATVVSKGNTAVITATGGTSYSWATATGIVSGQNSAILTVRPAVTTSYTVNVTNASGCRSSESITINVVDDYQALEAMNIMTPNGDGVNDFLIIKNLDMYPNNTLKVFDKAGREIYVEQNYANKWAGTLNGSTLAEGTYYYFLDFANGKGKIKGFVSIAH